MDLSSPRAAIIFCRQSARKDEHDDGGRAASRPLLVRGEAQPQDQARSGVHRDTARRGDYGRRHRDVHGTRQPGLHRGERRHHLRPRRPRHRARHLAAHLLPRGVDPERRGLQLLLHDAALLPPRLGSRVPGHLPRDVHRRASRQHARHATPRAGRGRPGGLPAPAGPPQHRPAAVGLWRRRADSQGHRKPARGAAQEGRRMVLGRGERARALATDLPRRRFGSGRRALNRAESSCEPLSRRGGLALLQRRPGLLPACSHPKRDVRGRWHHVLRRGPRRGGAGDLPLRGRRGGHRARARAGGPRTRGGGGPRQERAAQGQLAEVDLT